MPKPVSEKVVTFKLSNDLFKSLKTAAASEQRSVSGQLRQIIASAIAAHAVAKSN